MDLLMHPIVVGALITTFGALLVGLLNRPPKSNVHDELTMLEAQRGRKNTRVVGLSGTGSSSGMNVDIRNDNDFPMNVLSQAGTVIKTDNTSLQKMMAMRSQRLQVSAKSTEHFSLDALCLEAHKAPPPREGFLGQHRVAGLTRNRKLQRLLDAVREIERRDGKIPRHVLQCALWQVTDRLTLEQYARVVDAPPAAFGELRKTARRANRILERAGLKPSIDPDR